MSRSYHRSRLLFDDDKNRDRNRYWSGIAVGDIRSTKTIFQLSIFVLGELTGRRTLSMALVET